MSLPIKLLKKLLIFKKQFNNTITSNDHVIINKLDVLLTKGMIKAERMIKKYVYHRCAIFSAAVVGSYSYKCLVIYFLYRRRNKLIFWKVLYPYWGCFLFCAPLIALLKLRLEYIIYRSYSRVFKSNTFIKYIESIDYWYWKKLSIQ